MRWALSCLVRIGCGRVGFGSDDDARAQPPESLELATGPFSTTSTEDVDVPGATLTGISSANGQHAILGDSQIVLLGLP